MNKVIIIDYGMVLHIAGYASVNNKAVPPTYTACIMMLSYLRKIGVDESDTVIIAVDARNSWRKDYEKTYKANRSDQRKQSGLDWDNLFKQFNELLIQLDKATDFHIIEVERAEADDIMAVGARYFKDKEVILATFDSDLEQMWNYENVKIFTPKIKYKSTKGAYKIRPENFNANILIAKKIDKEVADNLTNPILNEEDYENRMLCVNLLTLPKFVEEPILEQLKNLPIKGQDLQWLPFQTSIRPKFETIYTDHNKVIKYADCVKYNEKKLLRKKKAKKRSKK